MITIQIIHFSWSYVPIVRWRIRRRLRCTAHRPFHEDRRRSDYSPGPNLFQNRTGKPRTQHLLLLLLLLLLWIMRKGLCMHWRIYREMKRCNRGNSIEATQVLFCYYNTDWSLRHGLDHVKIQLFWLFQVWLIVMFGIINKRSAPWDVAYMSQLVFPPAAGAHGFSHVFWETYIWIRSPELTYCGRKWNHGRCRLAERNVWYVLQSN